MAVAKINLNGNTWIDLTNDTVAANNLATGKTAHGADGEPIDGSSILLEDVLNRTVSGDIEITVTGQPIALNADSNGSRYYSSTFNGLLQQCPEITGLTIKGLGWVPHQLMRMDGGAYPTTTAKIKRISMPDALFASTRAFYDCRLLEDANFPSLKYAYGNYTVLGDSMFRNCYKLAHAEMGEVDRLQANMFNNCRVLTALILRKTSVVQLADVSALANTPLRGYNSTFSGHIYVPQDLIASYQTASNWSTLYEAYPEIFSPLEGSEYE